MKLKAYHSFIIFAVLVMSAIFSSVSSYRKAQYAIVKDMNQALAQTIEERQDQWITPDTIQSYRSHLSIDMLKNTSILCYAIGKPTELCSKEMQLDKHAIQGYANCSTADVFGMSNQRTSFTLMLMAMAWAIWAMLYHRKHHHQFMLPLAEASNENLSAAFVSDENINEECNPFSFGSLSYSSEDDSFYNADTLQAIHFTPMQHQLMQMFFEKHQLTKQEICDALWPKKPDASETLYTLIRRIKPIIEGNSNLCIESERGRAYRLTERQA